MGGEWRTSYYGYDGHGSVRLLTDTTGAVTDTYTFDAFGNLINSTGSTPNEYLYAGERLDANTGFYYLRARYLNPASGRFWGMDTFEGRPRDPLSLHKYTYADNNPVMLRDPSGMFPSPYDPEFGYAVEREIERIYRADHPGNANVTIGKEFGFDVALKPDILNHDLKTYLEIKPLSISGLSKGVSKMALNLGTLGLIYGYEPEYWWRPSEHYIYPMGKPTVFFNAEGLVLYTDEPQLLTEGVAVVTIAQARNLLGLLKGLGEISELGRIRELATLARGASNLQLQSRLSVSEVTLGRI